MDVTLQRFRDFAPIFEARFAALLAPQDDVHPRLLEAVHYAALGAGKRLRPYLAVRCCELAGGHADDAWHVAAAIECVHTFSLVHDDLPAMDNDDLRRGRPTCHKVYGDAMAILAGDALLALAFELLAVHTPDAGVARRLAVELSRATGWAGMIGGQAADIDGEAQSANLELTEYIHERKTAKLFSACCRLGAVAADAQEDVVDRLGRFGRLFGLVFQITDDLLDVTSTAPAAGKGVGKDEGRRKQTFPRCVGIPESRRRAANAVEAAVEALGPFATPGADLVALTRGLVDRSY